MKAEILPPQGFNQISPSGKCVTNKIISATYAQRVNYIVETIFEIFSNT